MAYVDVLNYMGAADLTAASGAAQFGGIVDLTADGAARPKLGTGTPLQIRATAETAITTSTGTASVLTVETSANANMSDSVVVATLKDGTNLAKGESVSIVLPADGLREYLSVKYTPSAGAFSAGKVVAFVEPHIG